MVLAISVLCFIVMVIVVVKKSSDTAKRLASEGKTVERKAAFYENAELFATVTTYEAVCEKLKTVDLSDAKATVQYDCSGEKTTRFLSSDGWSAALDAQGEKDGKNLLRFHFLNWETRSGVIQGFLTMNVLETAVEKAVLSLDASATVETHRIQVKTKSSFF